MHSLAYKKTLKKPRKIFVFGLVLFSIGMAACGAGEPTPSAQIAEDTATIEPTLPLPTETIVASIGAVGPETNEMGSDPVQPPSNDDLIALGEEIYQVTAGGIGCKACHGPDALGDVGPMILGKSAETITIQLDTNEAMQFIILTPEEIEALAAYLAYLQDQFEADQ